MRKIDQIIYDIEQHNQISGATCRKYLLELANHIKDLETFSHSHWSTFDLVPHSKLIKGVDKDPL